jgi:hypothetical protein
MSNTAPGAPAWSPSTPCVDTRADAAHRFTTEYSMTTPLRSDELVATATPDIDGDATPDAIYAFTPAEVPHTLVYVTRGTCGHLVAQAKGRVELQGAAAWPNLIVTDEGPAEAQGPETPPKISMLHWDGTAYR